MVSSIHVSQIYLKRRMRKLINHLICIFIGHKWKEHWRRKYIDPFNLDDAFSIDYTVTKCARCDKIKEEA